jgi:AcrR family transcriptional regulator
MRYAGAGMERNRGAMQAGDAKAVNGADGSRREQAKAERRARIVESATELLRDAGTTTLSVELIAERAGVSPGTVYNLFGTRGAVLKQVFDEDLRRYRERVEALPSADALDRMFDAIAVAASFYRAEPHFYRATLQSRGVTPGTEESGIAAAIVEPRMDFWTAMIGAASADGLLRADTPARALAVLVTHLGIGVMAAWIRNAINVERLERELAFGLALALSHYAQPAAAARLAARIAALERTPAK